ncbi:hypothetical protein CDL15_Pgr018365 [Punica granatum]|uniref:C2 domain-containing protein n=1 Tax=Punica granatum TaxID=22663 RepID=A0A218WJE2_PUNGR|nr:hypothetical protein CDL15_Pgr018365 [Punica granatum]
MTLELTALGANNLKDVSMFSKMDVYAVVSISADPRSAQKTPSDKEGGKNPRWEHPMKFAVDVNAARAHHIALVFKLRCNCSFGDSNIGEVRIPIRELIDEGARSPVPHAEGRGVGRTAMYMLKGGSSMHSWPDMGHHLVTVTSNPQCNCRARRKRRARKAVRARRCWEWGSL